jgi:hypothetical protein
VSTEEQWTEIRERRRSEFARLPRKQQERLVDAYEDFFVAVLGGDDATDAVFTAIRGHARRPEHGPAGHMGVIARRRTYDGESEPGAGASAS